MPWPRLLVLVRHAQSEGNVLSADERAQYEIATHDYDITPLGFKEAQITGVYLREEFGEFDIYYTSYYKRSKRTMQVMYPNARVFEDPRLAEAQRGIWHTMTREQIAIKYPEEIVRREKEGFYHYRAPGGENWPDVELRIHSFLGTLSRDYAGEKVLIVAHGHWMILFQRLIHHFSIEECEKRYHNGVFENASVTVYEGIEVEKNSVKNSRLVLSVQNRIPWREDNIDIKQFLAEKLMNKEKSS